MPPVSITDILFSTVSNLTGGLVTDLTSVIIAMITIAFLIMGFESIVEALQHTVASKKRGAAYGEAQQYLSNRDNAENKLDYDISNARYCDAVRRAR